MASGLLILGLSLLLWHLYRRYAPTGELGVPPEPQFSQLDKIQEIEKDGEEMPLTESEGGKVKLELVKREARL